MRGSEGDFQKERMFEFAERVGWKLRKRDEKLISDFCSKIGIKKGVLTVWLHNNKWNSRDQPTADILPEFVIQKVLCYLSFKEASRMAILSRTWLQAWLTLPNLLLVVCSDMETETGKRTRDKISTGIMDKIMERYRDRKIPIDKFEFLIDIASPYGYLFFLIDKWVDIALQNGVKDLFYRNLTYHSSFPIFKILTTKYLRELVLTNCNLVYFLLPPIQVGNCHSLRKLSLTFVTLDDNMLQTLLTSCPLILDLNIFHCCGWKKFKVQSLQKIRSFCITMNRDQLVEIQAPTLEHLSCSSYSLGELDIGEYQNLKSLELSGSFHSRRFNICSKSLRVLKIYDLNIFYSQNIEIIAPNLVSLEYRGHLTRLKLAKKSSKLKNLILDSDGYDLDDECFCQLVEFLSNSTSWSQVSLDIGRCGRCGEINRKHLKQHLATPTVDVLDINIKPREDCPTFVDALLWICHPRRLNISSTVQMIMYLIDRLMYMKNSSHSISHGSKRRLSQLKKVKAYKFNEKNESWHPVEPKSRELRAGNPYRVEKFYFLLDW